VRYNKISFQLGYRERRRRLHGFIGRALEARSAAPDIHLLAELAFHAYSHPRQVVLATH